MQNIGVLFNFQQECIPVGCVPSAAVASPGEGGICPGGCLPRSCVCPGGVHHPPVNRISDRCKNITFPQLLLRTVIIGFVQFSSGDIFKENQKTEEDDVII